MYGSLRIVKKRSKKQQNIFTSINSDKKESDAVKLGSFTSGSKLAPNGVDDITNALKSIKFKKEKKQNIKLEI